MGCAVRWLAATIAVSALLGHARAACPRDIYRGRICGGHGRCTPQNTCECDARHRGFDCGQKRCPRGPAWVAPARATDVAHYDVECSNKGTCDRGTGTCMCQDGFTGSACQRLACPDQCSDSGDCLSLRQLSQVFAVNTEPLYESAWDAEMIYGCQCRRGFQGYDCSKHSCPRGDDPLTTGQVNEVQILRCTGTSGYFNLYFQGAGAAVPFDATLSRFQTILTSIKTLPPVQVTFTDPTTIVCNDTFVNAVAIEFTQTFGPQPALKAFPNLKGAITLTGGTVSVATGGAVLAGRTSIVGTKEWAECSNRGHCDDVTGQCTCFTNPMPGYRSSDGYGNPGTRGDCGCANNKNLYGGPIRACIGELACSARGVCSGAPSFKCTCQRGWTEGDCAMRTCPTGPSWFRAPSNLNLVHNQWTTCSDAGNCDRTSGQCLCNTPFDGPACQFMKCPGEPTCNGHGRCLSIRQLSLEADVDDPSLLFDYGADPNNDKTWDRDSILGCKCDPGFQGYDCSLVSCPVGDDPTTTGQVDEVQLIKCVATDGTFQLLHRMSASPDIPFDISAALLREVLMAAFRFGDLIVEYSTGQMACSPTTASVKNVIRVTFPIDHGDIPALRVGSLSLTQASGAGTLLTADNGAVIDGMMSQMGTKERAVCSGRGHCNHDSGACECLSGFGSSDGRGNLGTRGDCGFRLPKTVVITS